MPAVTKGLKIQEEICNNTFEISYCGILSIKGTLSYQYLLSPLKESNSCQNKPFQSVVYQVGKCSSKKWSHLPKFDGKQSKKASFKYKWVKFNNWVKLSGILKTKKYCMTFIKLKKKSNFILTNPPLQWIWTIKWTNFLYDTVWPGWCSLGCKFWLRNNMVIDLRLLGALWIHPMGTISRKAAIFSVMQIHPNLKVYVVVNFLSQVIFVFLLFLGMVMYANELKQKKSKNYLR